MLGRRGRGSFAGFFDETGHGIAGLRAFAKPILRAFHFEREILALFQRVIGADFLNELAVARAAAVRHHDAKCRHVFCADPFHANFY